MVQIGEKVSLNPVDVMICENRIMICENRIMILENRIMIFWNCQEFSRRHTDPIGENLEKD